MSEYQYYEFIAVDRPLDTHEQAEVRSLSTRAQINAVSFVNEYHWGNFRGDPSQLMARYYDAHLYLANWGTRRIMLRLPRSVLDIDVAERYCTGDHLAAWTTDQHLVLDLTSEDDSGEWDGDAQGSLSAIVGVRGELAGGDCRPLYLAWLAGHSAGEYAFDRTNDDEFEPPVPPGLGTLTAAQRELADFLRIDDDLLAVAATNSPPLDEITDDPRQLAAWVTSLSPAEKDRLIQRVMQDQAGPVRMELLRRFREDSTPSPPSPPQRSVADLLDGVARQRAERDRREAAQRAEAATRRERARTLARERRLDDLARDEEAAWSRVEAMITIRNPNEYDAAVTLLTDLRALAERDSRIDEFTRRCEGLRRQHARKPSLLDRLDRAGL